MINYNNITGNTGYGVNNVDSAVLIDASYNWWDDPSGPGGWGPGTGDSVSRYVDYEPWLSQPVGIEERGFSQNVLARLQIKPNPFRDRTTITYEINKSASRIAEPIEIHIYDALGRLIKSMNRLTNSQSPINISWDGRDDLGIQAAKGVYFLKFEIEEFSETRKLLLIK